MAKPDTDKVFAGSIPKVYDTHLVPLIFEPYAMDAANRLRSRRISRLLEVAAGTGVVTRALDSVLPESVVIVATDLNQAMLDQAAAIGTKRSVEWRQADAMQLPFDDGMFDVVVCQFGVMFFPDKVRANKEARRVLRSGGHYVLVSFNRLELNPVPKAAADAVGALFPHDPPAYMERGPFSYVDPAQLEHDVLAAGFTQIRLETVALTTRVSARDAAQGIVLGSPFRSQIEQRDPSALDRALDAVTAALARWDGSDAPMSAHVVTATK
jgi:ubiquinone/menaquinone biosynthesis C-methylase UbiE